MKTSKTNKARTTSATGKTGKTSKPSKAVKTSTTSRASKAGKEGKAKRIQGPSYPPKESPEERAAGKAAFDHIIAQMLRPMVQYREVMERARIIAEEAKAVYEAEDAPPMQAAPESVKSAGAKGRRKR
jgi:hypothetical protein